MAETKIIKVVFGATKSAVASPRYRYDYGQVIEVSGIILPESFEARFSNAPTGASVRVLGENQRVAVPDELMQSGQSIWCYITVHDAMTDGRTMYSIRIPIKEATERTDAEPTPVQQDIITQAISALNVAQDEWNNMTAEAETLDHDDPATASYSDGVLTLGIPRGQRGEQGERGEKGDKGDTGDTGPTGPQGETGPQGPKGDTGETGATGPKGDKGDKGDQGIQGIQGVQGEKGEKGDKGDPGEVTLADYYKVFPTDTATGAIASFPDGADDLPLKSLVVNIDPVQDLSNGDPSPENICPISGYDSVSVVRAGKNLLDVDKYGNRLPRTQGGITWSKVGEEVYHVRGTATGASYFNVSFSTDFASAMPVVGFHGKSLYLSTTNSGIATSMGYFRENGSYSGLQNGRVLPDEAVALRAFLSIQNDATIDTDFNIQLELGSTSTDYEPYQGSTYDIEFPSEAGTVYGGKLDVLSGKLTVYPYYESYNGETLTGEWISDRDVYAVGTTPTIGAQVVNIGAEGTEYQLSPIEVKSLLGYNNIWADTGDTTAEYRADIKLYIEKLTQPEEDDMIADSAITSGQFFMIGNTLYRALANIASGATITVGTNAQRVSLSDALNLVNA